MPTGYTAALYEGEPQTFEEYALSCARNFGALILMRDDPMDAPIPEFAPDTKWHDEKIVEARATLARLETMTSDEAGLEAQAEYEKVMAEWRRANDERRARRVRYTTMLEKVRQWKPPTADHQGLRDFMESQLVDSIKFDCSLWEPPMCETAAEYMVRLHARAERDIEYHAAEREAEIGRAQSRNEWVRQLRASLDVRVTA